MSAWRLLGDAQEPGGGGDRELVGLLKELAEGLDAEGHEGLSALLLLELGQAPADLEDSLRERLLVSDAYACYASCLLPL